MTVRALRNAREISLDIPETTALEERRSPASLLAETKKMRQTIGAEPLVSAEPVEIDASKIRTKSDLMKVLVSIVEARSKGRRVAMVFDIDNTLMDTRHRTAAAATSFRFRDAHPMQHATFDKVAYRPEETCRELQIVDPDTVKAFSDHFEQFFWMPENIALDKPIDGPIALASLARSLGAQLYFLTGRTSTFRKETEEQLKKIGLAPETAGHLIMKSPKRDQEGRLEPTEKFKARELRKIYREKISIAAFVTEGSRDTCWLQRHVPEVRRFLFLDFPIDEPGYQVSPHRTIFLPLDIDLPKREEVLARFRGAKS